MASAGSREVGRISVRVVPDTDGFRRELKRQLEAITKGLEAKVNIDPDLDGFRQKVNAATKGFDAHVQVHADTSRARAEMFALQRAGGNGGIFSTLGASISEMTQSMGKSIATARPFGVSIVAIAAAASLAVPAIGLMSGALVALPGILSAVIAPLGAVLMGMQGIKQALVNSGWAVFDKKGKLKAGEQLAKIQDSVSKVFETGLTPVFTKLLAIIPALQEGFGAIAQGLVGMTDGFVSAITSAKGLDQIKTMFRNIGDALGQAGPGIRDFTAAMLTLSTEFSKKLPGMAQSFNNWAGRVLTWVDKITKVDASGLSQFDRAMKGLGDSLKAAGGAIGDLFLKGFDWISNPENSAKVVRFFQDMKTAIDGLWPILDKTFTRLEQLSALAAPLIKATGALASMTGDRKGDPNVQQNGDAGQKAWDGFKTSFLNAFDPAWLVNTITSMFNAVPWSSVWQGLKDSWNAVVSFFQGAVSFFANMWSSIQSAASGAWNGIVSAVSAAISNVVSAIVSGGSQIMAEVGSWPGKIASALAGLFQAGFTAGTQLVQGFIQGIGSLITSAVAKATELASSVKNAVTGFLGIHSPSRVMADIGGFIGQGLIDGLKSKQGEIEKTAQGIGQSVKDAFDWSGYAQRGIGAGFAFAGANADQLASDLGIGGKGAFSQLAEQGIGFGTKLAGQLLGGSTFNFHVADVDDAIAIKNNQLNRQALGIYQGR
ncbi:hypothetical protein BKG80_19740 [Mycobacteroides chelonae]|uniref:phage tail protein n=1 Tax=Mycobacteroides chelonae TaxID=1774 RepID=UPI0008AA0D80|nr:hypothetical protein [Mycobacteroides chelonae]MBF9349424.1 hypothetical protein [Mycobacteroides chelonae]OHU35094.1 hypothetical protein BKG80_19740 [Mycobacteroides chelonae]